jgi:hypothetical protein
MLILHENELYKKGGLDNMERDDSYFIKGMDVYTSKKVS